MRNALKSLFTHQIILEDGSHFYYTIRPYELRNALGYVIAVLQEYNFTKKGDDKGQFSCKLYKTKEENWYDIEKANSAGNNPIVRVLKSAIDKNNQKIGI